MKQIKRISTFSKLKRSPTFAREYTVQLCSHYCNISLLGSFSLEDYGRAKSNIR